MNKKRMIQLGIILLFLIYCLILIRLIVFKYPSIMMKEILASWGYDSVYRNIKTANFVPFRSILSDLLASRRYNTKLIIYNTIAFMPMGFILPLMTKRAKSFSSIIILSATFSLVIELIQLITALGAFDIDDILLNTLGAIIGFTLYLVLRKIKLLLLHPTR